MIRVFSVILGLVFSLVFFSLLSKSIALTGISKKTQPPPIDINFLQTKQDSKIEKIRKIPPKPSLVKTQDLKVQQSEQKTQNTPKLALNININKLDLKNSLSASSIDTEVMPRLKIPPAYPRRAKMLKKQGFVVLEVHINKRGDVEKVSVIKAQPKGLFERSAIRAIRQWKFSPKIINGEPQAQKATQTIEFKLE